MVKGIGSLTAWLASFAAVVGACSGQAEKGNQQTGGSPPNAMSGAGGKPPVNGKGGAPASGASAVAGSASGGVSSGGSTSGGGDSGGVAGGGELNDAGEPSSGGSGISGGGVGGAPLPDPTLVKPSVGCGTDAPQATGTFVMHTIQTSGVKDANCAAQLNGQPKCGPWSLEREYHLWLPPGYDKAKPYPLVLQAPGCGGIGTDVYPLSPTNMDTDPGVAGEVIRVGLRPPPNSIGHGTNQNQSCFDDKEGDDSVDFAFYETLYDSLKTELCIDENRVFASGNSSGAWLANELGCKYAGDTNGHAIRGVMTNQGGLPTEPQYKPTCSERPMAGVWVWEFNDGGQPFDTVHYAVDRAMKVNGCSAASYDTASLVNFPIAGGNPDTTCKLIVGCPVDYPLVACRMSGTGHGGHDTIVNPAFSTFIRLLTAP